VSVMVTPEIVGHIGVYCCAGANGEARNRRPAHGAGGGPAKVESGSVTRGFFGS